VARDVAAIESAHQKRAARSRRRQREEEQDDPPFSNARGAGVSSDARAQLAAARSVGAGAGGVSSARAELRELQKFVAPEGRLRGASPDFVPKDDLRRFGAPLAQPVLPRIRGMSQSPEAGMGVFSSDGDEEELVRVSASSSEESAPEGLRASLSSDEEEQQQYDAIPALLDVEDAERVQREKQRQKDAKAKAKVAKKKQRAEQNASDSMDDFIEDDLPPSRGSRMDDGGRQARSAPKRAGGPTRVSDQAKAAAAALRARRERQGGGAAAMRMSLADARDAGIESGARMRDDLGGAGPDEDGMDLDIFEDSPAWPTLPSSRRRGTFAAIGGRAAADTAASRQRVSNPDAFRAQQRLKQFRRQQREVQARHQHSQQRQQRIDATLRRGASRSTDARNGPISSSRAVSFDGDFPSLRPPSGFSSARRAALPGAAMMDEDDFDLGGGGREDDGEDSRISERGGAMVAARSAERVTVQGTLPFVSSGHSASVTALRKPSRPPLPPMHLHVLTVKLTHPALPINAPRQWVFLLPPFPVSSVSDGNDPAEAAAQFACELGLGSRVNVLPNSATAAHVFAVIQQSLWDRAAVRCTLQDLRGHIDAPSLPSQVPLSDVLPLLSRLEETVRGQFRVHTSTLTHTQEVPVKSHAPVPASTSFSSNSQTARMATVTQQLQVHVSEMHTVQCSFQHVGIAAVYEQLCRTLLRSPTHPAIAQALQQGQAQLHTQSIHEKEAGTPSLSSIVLPRYSFHLSEDHLLPLLLALRGDDGQLLSLQLAHPALGDLCAVVLKQLFVEPPLHPLSTAPLSSLRILSLAHCSISEQAWCSLLPSWTESSLPELTSLDLSDTSIGDECIEQLGRMSASLPQLRSLLLAGCVGLTGARDPWRTVQLLTAHSGLRHLSLARCPLTHDTVEMLLRSLVSSVEMEPKLSSLDLDALPCMSSASNNSSSHNGSVVSTQRVRVYSMRC
jgi:hypothetical protein